MKPGNIPVTFPATEHPNCAGTAEILQRIGDKWTVLVVVLLGDGPLRFNELRRRIGGISQRMLTLTLRGLERDGLVSRTVFPTVPPRVEYELTSLGRSLLGRVAPLAAWGSENLPAIAAARLRFDAAAAEIDPLTGRPNGQLRGQTSISNGTAVTTTRRDNGNPRRQ